MGSFPHLLTNYFYAFYHLIIIFNFSFLLRIYLSIVLLVCQNIQYIPNIGNRPYNHFFTFFLFYNIIYLSSSKIFNTAFVACSAIIIINGFISSPPCLYLYYMLFLLLSFFISYANFFAISFLL